MDVVCWLAGRANAIRVVLSTPLSWYPKTPLFGLASVMSYAGPQGHAMAHGRHSVRTDPTDWSA